MLKEYLHSYKGETFINKSIHIGCCHFFHSESWQEIKKTEILNENTTCLSLSRLQHRWTCPPLSLLPRHLQWYCSLSNFWNWYVCSVLPHKLHNPSALKLNPVTRMVPLSFEFSTPHLLSNKNHLSHSYLLKSVVFVFLKMLINFLNIKSPIFQHVYCCVL